MEPGVCGPRGLSAVHIAFKIDVESVIILSLPMADNTAWAMI